MTISSSVLPTAVERTYAHSSSTSSGNAALQAFTTTGQEEVSALQVAGFEGETAMRVLFWSSIDGKPSQVCHSRVALVPIVSGPNDTIYDLTFAPFILPPGDFFFTVQGETTDWAWFGERAGGYPSADELSFSLTTAPATPHAGERWFHAGQDAFGWAIGQMGTPGSDWNKAVAHSEVDPESAAITAELDSAWGGGFLGIGMAKHKASNEHFVSSILDVDNATPEYEPIPRTQYLEARDTGSVTLPEDFHLDPHGDRQFVRFPANGRSDGVGGAAVIQNEDGVEPVLEPDGDAHVYTLNEDSGELQETYKVDGIGGAPVFFTPDNVKANPGESLNHVLPFTQNNAYTRADEFWGAATHNPLRSPGHSASANAMPYGCHFRLKDSFVIDPAWPPALRSILKTLKMYGMVHLDGSTPGQLVATNDRYATTGWDDPDVNLNPNDLTAIAALRWTDFDVVAPTRKSSMNDCSCRRTPAQPEYTTW